MVNARHRVFVCLCVCVCVCMYVTQVKNRELVLDSVDSKQGIYIYNCKDCVIHVSLVEPVCEHCMGYEELCALLVYAHSQGCECPCASWPFALKHVQHSHLRACTGARANAHK